MKISLDYRVVVLLVLLAGVGVEALVLFCGAAFVLVLVVVVGVTVAVPSELVVAVAGFEHSFLQDFLSLQHFLSANIVPVTNKASASITIFFMFLNF